MELLWASLSLVGLAGLSQRRRWGWLVATVASLGYGYFFARQGLLGQAGLQGLYALLQLYGWWGCQASAAFRSWSGAYLYLLGGLPLGWLLQSWLGSIDAWLTAFSLAAQLMTSLRYRQVWRCWVLLDLAAATWYASLGLWPTAGLYLALAGVAEWAHRSGEAA